MKISLIGVCLVMLVLAAAWPRAEDQSLGVHVSPIIGLAPTDIVVRAFIEPDPRNRAVVFSVDSAAFYSSSDAELEGDRAPRTKQVTFRSVPAGSYKVRVTLIGTDGQRTSTTRGVLIR